MSKKVIIITGASSGIGLATANLFSKKGYEVYRFSRRKIEGLAFNQIEADVNDEDSVKSAVNQVLENTDELMFFLIMLVMRWLELQKRAL